MAQQAINDFLSRADDWFVTAMNTHALIGLAVGIVQRNEVVYTQGFGLADVATQQPVTPATVFRVGSLAQATTAVGVLHLWEQQGFSLDAPVNDYLKHYQITHSYASAPPVTFRHLLTHTAGLGELRSWGDIMRPDRGLSAEPDVPIPTPWEYYARGLQPEMYPQMKVSPSAHAYNTLGQLIEDMSSKTFDTYMHDHVFVPAGMQTSDYLLSSRVHPALAQGYNVRNQYVVTVPYREVIPRAAGALFSTIEDLCQYVIALLHGGTNAHGTLVSPATMALLFEPHYQLSPHLPAMGFAFTIETWQGHRLATLHATMGQGFAATMLLALDDDIGVVLVSNTETDALAHMAHTVYTHMLPTSDAADHKPLVLETPHLWGSMCGYYRPDKGTLTNMRMWEKLGGEVEIFVRDHRLHMRSLAGALRHGVPLVATDANNPLAFETTPGMAVPWTADVAMPRLQLEFKQTLAHHVNIIDRLAIGVDQWYKQPSSIRWQAMLVGVGAVAGAAWAWSRWVSRSS